LTIAGLTNSNALARTEKTIHLSFIVGTSFPRQSDVPALSNFARRPPHWRIRQMPQVNYPGSNLFPLNEFRFCAR
jgi:hypothetical protein